MTSAWVPGRRPSSRRRTYSKFPIRRLVVADINRVNVTVGEFDLSDENVQAVTEKGLTPELNERDQLITLSRDDATISINLTRFREDELDIFEEVISYAIKRARPVVQERDRVAREAYARGDGTYERLHRGTPKISYIERKESADD